MQQSRAFSILISLGLSIASVVTANESARAQNVPVYSYIGTGTGSVLTGAFVNLANGDIVFGTAFVTNPTSGISVPQTYGTNEIVVTANVFSTRPLGTDGHLAGFSFGLGAQDPNAGWGGIFAELNAAQNSIGATVNLFTTYQPVPKILALLPPLDQFKDQSDDAVAARGQMIWAKAEELAQYASTLDRTNPFSDHSAEIAAKANELSQQILSAFPPKDEIIVAASRPNSFSIATPSSPVSPGGAPPTIDSATIVVTGNRCVDNDPGIKTAQGALQDGKARVIIMGELHHTLSTQDYLDAVNALVGSDKTGVCLGVEMDDSGAAQMIFNDPKNANWAGFISQERASMPIKYIDTGLSQASANADAAVGPDASDAQWQQALTTVDNTNLRDQAMNSEIRKWLQHGCSRMITLNGNGHFDDPRAGRQTLGQLTSDIAVTVDLSGIAACTQH